MAEPSDPLPTSDAPAAAPAGGVSAAVLLTPSVLLATGFGVGLYLPAPGTFGALMGTLLAWGLGWWPGAFWPLLLVVALCLAGVPLCTAAGRALGGPSDHQAIIFDEIVAMPLVFLVVPPRGWPALLAGFALFRLFDITKLPPAAQLERLPKGLGVMADDWVAAAYSCAALAGLAWLDRQFGWQLFSNAGG